LLAMVAAAVALNVALMAAAATVSDGGALSALLLLVSVTLTPPAGAAAARVTVQALTALWPKVLGLHASEETPTDGAKPMVTLAELLL
jgi:hypothetical protein